MMRFATPPQLSHASLNKAIQLNISCLLMHLLFYTSLPALLMSRHNPFAELIVAFAAVAIVGIFLCLDFMIPVYVEAKLAKYRNITKPIGWLLSLNIASACGMMHVFVL
jgi:hypothetical protein